MRKRNLVFVIIASIVTLGLYCIYWMFSTRNELVKKRLDVPSPWIVFAPLLGLVLIALLQMISLFLAETPTQSNITTLNIISIIVGAISVVAIIPLFIYWLWKYSKAVEKVTKKELTSGFTFALAIVLSILGAGVIWPAIVQYHFNKVSTT